jgi:hypothetical protein
MAQWKNPIFDFLSIAVLEWRTQEMMNIIDTDGDGMISRAEWDAFQEKVLKTLDSHKRGKLDTKIFARRTEARITTFATGGYARGLDGTELARKIDTNGDGWISHDEWMTYQGNIFDMMNTSVTHKDEIGHEEMFATGGRTGLKRLVEQLLVDITFPCHLISGGSVAAQYCSPPTVVRARLRLRQIRRLALVARLSTCLQLPPLLLIFRERRFGGQG